MAWLIYISLATRRSSLINLYTPTFSTCLAERVGLGMCAYVMLLTTIISFWFLLLYSLVSIFQ